MMRVLVVVLLLIGMTSALEMTAVPANVSMISTTSLMTTKVNTIPFNTISVNTVVPMINPTAQTALNTTIKVDTFAPTIFPTPSILPTVTPLNLNTPAIRVETIVPTIRVETVAPIILPTPGSTTSLNLNTTTVNTTVRVQTIVPTLAIPATITPLNINSTSVNTPVRVETIAPTIRPVTITPLSAFNTTIRVETILPTIKADTITPTILSTPLDLNVATTIRVETIMDTVAVSTVMPLLNQTAIVIPKPTMAINATTLNTRMNLDGMMTAISTSLATTNGNVSSHLATVTFDASRAKISKCIYGCTSAYITDTAIESGSTIVKTAYLDILPVTLPCSLISCPPCGCTTKTIAVTGCPVISTVYPPSSTVIITANVTITFLTVTTTVTQCTATETLTSSETVYPPCGPYTGTLPTCQPASIPRVTVTQTQTSTKKMMKNVSTVVSRVTVYPSPPKAPVNLPVNGPVNGPKFNRFHADTNGSGIEEDQKPTIVASEQIVPKMQAARLNRNDGSTISVGTLIPLMVLLVMVIL